MTQLFDENGIVCPVTAIMLEPLTVTMLRTLERDGYEAVQVGYGKGKKSRRGRAASPGDAATDAVNAADAKTATVAASASGDAAATTAPDTAASAQLTAAATRTAAETPTDATTPAAETPTDTPTPDATNAATPTNKCRHTAAAPDTAATDATTTPDTATTHANAAAKTSPALPALKYRKEFRGTGEYGVGDTVDGVTVFDAGDVVRVRATAKGKGFQGVVKRHGFAGGPRTHGQKHNERQPGSIGSGLRARVPKGTRMAGRTGGAGVTVKGTKVVLVDKERGLLLLHGSIPGRRGSLVEIQSV